MLHPFDVRSVMVNVRVTAYVHMSKFVSSSYYFQHGVTARKDSIPLAEYCRVFLGQHCGVDAWKTFEGCSPRR
jgi:hypothetical protein